MTTNKLRVALRAAFSAFKGPLSRTYLSELGSFERSWLEVYWEDYGRGDESLLAFAERVRKGGYIR